MLFKVKEIGDDGLSLDLPLTPEWLAVHCPDLGATPGLGGLAVRGQLLATEAEVFLRGKLRGVLETSCSRCLEKARVSIDVPLTITFLPKSVGEDAEEENEENLDVAFYDGDQVDLAPEIRDQLLLAYPFTPVCREDCAGLCSVCGGNRNQTTCACRPAELVVKTPLAAALKKLKV